jgi:hypothetical protein
MKIKIVLTIGVTWLLSSCESLEELNPTLKPEYLKGKLKTYIVNLKDTNKSIKTEYAYTEKELIEKIKITNTMEGINSEESFVYDAENKVISSTNTVLQNQISTVYKRTYTYGKDNKVFELKEQSQNSPEINYVFYTYSGEGKLIEYVKRQVSGNSNKFKGSASFAWKNDNVILLNETFADGLVEEVDYLYGDKTNPLNSIYADFLKIPNINIEYLSKNNLTFFKKFFDGTKYKIESVLDEAQKITSQKVYIFKDNDYVLFSENIFEYYN